MLKRLLCLAALCAFGAEKVTPLQEYAQRAQALAPEDAKGRYDLAKWCKGKGLDWQARLECEAVLRLDPKHPAALKTLEELGGPVRAGPADPQKPLAGIPKRIGWSLVKTKANRVYWLMVPEAVLRDEPLPLVLLYTYNVHQELWKDDQQAWEGFPGLVVMPLEYSEGDVAFSKEILESLAALFPVDRTAVLVWEFRTRQLAAHIGDHPDLFAYGFSNGTWSPPSWPTPPRLSPRLQPYAKKAHVVMKLTGIDYKPIDRGFDDAKMKAVQDYWKALGVEDVVIERHPKSTKYPERDEACIQTHVSEIARTWFEGKLKERSPAPGAK